MVAEQNDRTCGGDRADTAITSTAGTHFPILSLLSSIQLESIRSVSSLPRNVLWNLSLIIKFQRPVSTLCHNLIFKFG
jgi:hypothetical protein